MSEVHREEARGCSLLCFCVITIVFVDAWDAAWNRKLIAARACFVVTIGSFLGHLFHMFMSVAAA